MRADIYLFIIIYLFILFVCKKVTKLQKKKKSNAVANIMLKKQA